MGQFAMKVRRNKIPGPNQPGFRRVDWEVRLDDSSLDKDDKRILDAGLFFDQLLCFLRAEKKLLNIPISRHLTTRIIVAIATQNLFKALTTMEAPAPDRNVTPTVTINEFLEKKIEIESGVHVSPDSLITGAGDGMKHMLWELLKAMPETTAPKEPSENELNCQTVDAVACEFNIAITYNLAVELWNDCIGNGYGLTINSGGVTLSPFDIPMEIARTVSKYRRTSIAAQDAMLVTEMWMYHWSNEQKKAMCEIPLVTRVAGRDRIEQIELTYNDKTVSAASSAVSSKLWLKHGYYQFLLDCPLPKYSDFSLNQIVLGWQLLQSLAQVIFNSFKPIKPGDVNQLLEFAPRISRLALLSAFVKAFSFQKRSAELLINVFVFDPESSKEVWFQPLIPCKEDLCLVVPCILSVHLERVVEGWMRHGGLELDRRGPEFEKFCRDQLAATAQCSIIKQSTQILNRSVKFKPLGEREEEIDIVLILADTILLVEAKCILWPDESLQFANYRDTIESAVKQVIRKRDAVKKHYGSFANKLTQLGYKAPENCSLACCVLTNSAIYVGFPIDGVPIVDLSILSSFLKNEHVKFETRQKGKSVDSFSINFYADPKEAGEVLGQYLADPPQLSDTKQFAKKQEIELPFASVKYGKFLSEYYSVEVDMEEMQRKYENKTVKDLSCLI